MTIYYDSRNHISVIFAIRGTVWRSVLPFCIMNIAINFAIYILNQHLDVDVRFEEGGTSMLTIMVAFLVVSRTTSSYMRFWQARSQVSGLLRKMIQVAHLATSATGSVSRDDEGAAKWRSILKCRLINSIRSTVCLLRNTDIVEVMLLGEHSSKDEMEMEAEMKSYTDPTTVANSIHDIIILNKQYLKTPLTIQEEMMLHNLSGNFLDLYAELCKFATTPYPFPVVQMARGMIIVWLFLLPFYMSHGEDGPPYGQFFAIFFITYGFLGLEFVAMELDDPFGDDLNDIDIKRLATATILGITNILDGDSMRYFNNDNSDKEGDYSIESSKTESMSDNLLPEIDVSKIDALAGKVQFRITRIERNIDVDEKAKGMEGARNLEHMGDTLAIQGKHDEALEKYRESLVILRSTDVFDADETFSTENEESLKANRDSQVVRVLASIGHQLYAKKEYEKALECYEEVLPVQLEIFGRNHEQVINLFHVMGKLYFAGGNNDKALDMFTKELKGKQHLAGKFDQSMTTVLFNLGLVHEKKYHYDWAMECFVEVLYLQRATQGVNHKVVASTLCHIGNMHLEFGDFDSARKAYERSLKIQARVDNVTNEILPAIDAVCSIYEGTDKIENAMSCFDETLKVLSKKKAKLKTNTTVELLFRMGDICLYKLSDAGRALKCFEEALQTLLLTDQKSDDGTVSKAYFKVALTLITLSKYKKSIEYLKKALAICKEAYGVDNLHTVRVLILLGDAYLKSKESKRGIDFLHQAMRSIQSISEEDPTEKARSLHELGVALFGAGEGRAARTCLEDALDVRKETLGLDDITVAECSDCLGGIHASTENNELSLRYYEDALRIRRMKLDANNDQILDTMSKIACVFAKRGKFQRSMSLYSQVLGKLSDKQSEWAQKKTIQVRILMGHVCVEMKEFENALQNYSEVIGSKYLTVEDAVSISSSRRAVGIMISKEGNREGALKVLGETLLLAQKTLRETHEEFANALSDIGSVHYTWGDSKQAIENYNIALRLLKHNKRIKEDSPSMQQTKKRLQA
eukprot:CAMPEP_0196817064 /NCGR_PEP_ID=MMETSP1362-20130617/58616_1 /TAXON_ID=163516 /ORGANISM="Leptocylindrus danicus, Strain CCMP1856" /LENGTH=1034 /DNA_ID=CAMNT_0042194615 /DNA_START=82 /DNA_END=3182 /DNA_ORIENTATION=+